LGVRLNRLEKAVLERIIDPSRAARARVVSDKRRNVRKNGLRSSRAVAQFDDQRSRRVEAVQPVTRCIVGKVTVFGWGKGNEGISEEPGVGVHGKPPETRDAASPATD